MKPTDAKLTDLLNRALEAKVVVKGGGGWFAFGEQKLGQGVEKTITHLEAHADTVAAIEAKLAPVTSAGMTTQSLAKPDRETGAPETLAASSGINTAGVEPPVAGTRAATSEKMDVTGGESAAPDFLTLSFPLPDGMPAEAFKAASIVVKSKAERGRWRTGRQFTREETAIPYGDLSQGEIDALTGDAELIVSLRVPKPA